MCRPSYTETGIRNTTSNSIHSQSLSCTPQFAARKLRFPLSGPLRDVLRVVLQNTRFVVPRRGDFSGMGAFEVSHSILTNCGGPGSSWFVLFRVRDHHSRFPVKARAITRVPSEHNSYPRIAMPSKLDYYRFVYLLRFSSQIFLTFDLSLHQNCPTEKNQIMLRVHS